MKKLRIAQFVTTEVNFPLPKDFLASYAPIPLAYNIAEKLSKKGHKIVFFGPKSSHANNFEVRNLNILALYKNPIITNVSAGTRERISNLFDQYCIGQIIQEHHKKPFDLIHIHLIDRALPFVSLFPNVPFVFTLHDTIFPWRASLLKMFASSNEYLISITKSQQKETSKIKYFSNIYNGIDLNLFPFSEQSKSDLLWIGRIIPRKGVNEAIQIAKKSSRPLLLIGASSDEEYWETKIKPELNNNIQHFGFIAYNKLYYYYRQAKIFLMPIMWEEPFGLVVPEANACGTPVVAFARGSMPELIKDGYNGFLVKPGNIKGMVKAVKRIYDMPKDEYLKMRQNCRKHVEDNFTIEKMVDGYEKVYQQIINR